MSFPCTQEGCNVVCKTNWRLTTHLWQVHTLGNGKMFPCTQEGCNLVFKRNGDLTTHLWQVHTLGKGKKMFPCTQEGCNVVFKTKGNLTTHLWQVHTLGNGKMFPCTQEGCNLVFKRNGDLTKHLWQVHTLGKGKMIPCTQEGCNVVCKTNSALTIHLWQVHTLGKGKKMVPCTQEGCNLVFKTNGQLMGHLWQVHTLGKGKKMFPCTQEGCNLVFKTKGILTTHLSGKHDIGKIECPICCKNVSRITKFNDPKTNDLLEGCRGCCKKVTGHDSRVEKKMVDYLKKDERIGPFITLTDAIIKGNKCKVKRRPDVLISCADLDLWIIVECDEKQHRDRDRTCELGRMDELLDVFQGSRTVFVRWNPDKCKKDGVHYSCSLDECLKKLKDFILEFVKPDNPKIDLSTLVYYMFYNSDNEIISDRHPFELVY